MGKGLISKTRFIANVDEVVYHPFWAVVILIFILEICRVLKSKKSVYHTQLIHNLGSIPSENLPLCGRDCRRPRFCLYLKVMF